MSIRPSFFYYILSIHHNALQFKLILPASCPYVFLHSDMAPEIDFDHLLHAFFTKFDLDSNEAISMQEIRDIKLEDWTDLEKTSEDISKFVEITNERANEIKKKKEQEKINKDELW